MALTGARLGARLSGAPTTVTRSLFGEGRHTEADLLTWIRCTAVSAGRRLFIWIWKEGLEGGREGLKRIWEVHGEEVRDLKDSKISWDYQLS